MSDYPGVVSTTCVAGCAFGVSFHFFLLQHKHNTILTAHDTTRPTQQQQQPLLFFLSPSIQAQYESHNHNKTTTTGLMQAQCELHKTTTTR